MEIISTIETKLTDRTVVTIGKFDGFHRGHTELFHVARRAAGPGEKILVFTFLMPEDSKGCRSLLTREEKIYAARKLGAEIYLECPFTEEVRRMDAMDFLQGVLLDKLNMRHIVAGTDCSFGYRGAGNAELLAEKAEQLGYRASVVDKVRYGGETISSTRIRKAIEEGKIKEANEMLGFAYPMSGTVMHGHRNGHKIGFPTINLAIPDDKIVPRFGVYASRVNVGGKAFYGMSNVGKKPTVSGHEQPNIETHLFGTEEDFYGCSATVELLDFLREEQRFPTMAHLANQLRLDKGYALDRIKRHCYNVTSL